MLETFLNLTLHLILLSPHVVRQLQTALTVLGTRSLLGIRPEEIPDSMTRIRSSRYPKVRVPLTKRTVLAAVRVLLAARVIPAVRTALAVLGT